MRFRYRDPVEQSTVDGELRTRTEVSELVGMVLRLPVEPTPAVEFVGHDGSSLLLGISGPRAVLLTTGADGRAAHSLGPANLIGEAVVFDYFGSLTELPGAYALPTSEAVAAVADYVESGVLPGELLAPEPADA